MKISRNHLKEIVRDSLIENQEYEKFFQHALDKAGKSFVDMNKNELKSFFNKIDSAWLAKGEKKEVKENITKDSEIEKLAKKSKNYDDFVSKILIGKEIAGYDIIKLTKDKKYMNFISNIWKYHTQSVNESTNSSKVGDIVIVTMKNGDIVKGKIEKLNPFKIRTDPTSTRVIPDVAIKSVIKESVNENKCEECDKESINEDQGFVVIYKVKKEKNNRKIKPAHAAYSSEADAKKFLKSVEKDGGRGMIVKSNIRGLSKSNESINESITENATTVHKKGKILYVDSDFVNSVKGKLPNSELKHAGFGDFFLQTKQGQIFFSRVNGKFNGMIGRAHQVTDNQKGKLFALLIKKMGAKIIKESKSINESSDTETNEGIGTIILTIIAGTILIKLLYKAVKSVLSKIGSSVTLSKESLYKIVDKIEIGAKRTQVDDAGENMIEEFTKIIRKKIKNGQITKIKHILELIKANMQ